LCGRLDEVGTVGAVIEAVVEGSVGVRPVALAADVPHTTARGWVRRFVARANDLSVGFWALAAELGAEAEAVIADAGACAVAALRAAFDAALSFAGWFTVGLWRFVSSVSGGRLLATNTISPYLIVGSRRFMPPVP
jgi:hypothetical protein